MLRSGDWVEIKSKEEILATLDRQGRLEGLPFMPEMIGFCGRRIRVASSAHKTCGPNQGNYVALRTNDFVHLGFRCDGSAHGGCQNLCQFFWHRDWLKVDGEAAGAPPFPRKAVCSEADLEAATRQPDLDGEKRYMCQALALKDFTKPLSWWDARTYWKAYRTKNQTPWELAKGLTFMVYTKIGGHHGQRFGARSLYDAFQSLTGGTRFPRRHGEIPEGMPTPLSNLGLKPGDYVRIKSHDQILKTLSYDGKNRGMFFDAELVPFCGRVFRVEQVVERFIDEEVGVMRRMKTPAAILENVYCLSLYTGKRAFCTRGYISWWREAWLDRVSADEVAKERVVRMKVKAPTRPEAAIAPTPVAARLSRTVKS